jgi:hypothetical protein
MLHQRDLMKEKHLELSPPSDKDAANVALSQKNFITGIYNIRAAFEALAAIAPAFARMALQHLESNLAYYTAMVDAGEQTL